MKNKDNTIKKNKLYWVYLLGFFIILAMPLLAWPPFFWPPSWAKTIIFRTILSILIFLFISQTVLKKTDDGPLNRFRALTNKKSRLFFPFLSLIILFLIFLLSTIFSQDPRFSLWDSPHRGDGFVNFAFYVFLMLLLFLIIKGKDWKKIWDFSFLIGILVSLVALFQYLKLFRGFLMPQEASPPSTVGTSTLLAIYLLFLLFLSLSFGIKEKSKKKFFYYFCCCLFFFVIIITGCRAVYLGLIASFFYFFFFYPVKCPSSNPALTGLFNGANPKRLKKAKILAGLLLILIIFAIYLVNITPKFPSFIENNKPLSYFFHNRLSIKLVLVDLTETRFSVWKIAFQAMKEKPLLGWGPENFQIGFDKYYDPSLPQMPMLWWDRAHNIFLDIGVTSGLIGLFAYFLFFGVLFWTLQKSKKANPARDKSLNGAGETNKTTLLAVQAMLLGYFISLLFSFNSAVTYLTLFLIIGYSFCLIFESSDRSFLQSPENKMPPKANNFYRIFPLFILFIGLIFFVWKYNIIPFQINTAINKTGDLVDKQKCEEGLANLEKIFPQRSILDAYLRLKYVDFLKQCANDPTNDLEYAQKGKEALKDNLKTQPHYTRTWLLLASFNDVLIAREKDQGKKQQLIEEANYYLKQAQELSPKRPEILAEWALSYFIREDYQKMKEKSEECVKISQEMSSCYWYLGLSEIALNKEQSAKDYFKIAIQKRYNAESPTSLNQLAIVYSRVKNYKELAPIYEQLVRQKPDEIQYYATLASLYKGLGNYEKAREIALKIIDKWPEAKEQVEEFLKTLP